MSGIARRLMGVKSEAQPASLEFTGASVGTNAPSMPAHQPGDVLIVFAASTSVNFTVNSMPSGWNLLNFESADFPTFFLPLRLRGLLAYRVAQSSNETGVFFSGSERTVILNHRNADVPTVTSSSFNSTSTPTYPANNDFPNAAATLVFIAARSENASVGLPLGFHQTFTTTNPFRYSIGRTGESLFLTEGFSQEQVSLGTNNTAVVTFTLRLPEL